MDFLVWSQTDSTAVGLKYSEFSLSLSSSVHLLTNVLFTPGIYCRSSRVRSYSS